MQQTVRAARSAVPVRVERGVWSLDDVDLHALAKEYGTPLFVYSASTVRARAKELLRSLPGRVYYAVKANPRIGLLGLIREEGLWAEVVSLGEIEAALRAGFTPDELLFNGNGKRPEEIAGALERGVTLLNVESAGQAELVAEGAEAAGSSVRVLVRVNVLLDAGTHPYVATAAKDSKFGLFAEELPAVVERITAAPRLDFEGLHCHVGSDISDAGLFAECASTLISLAEGLKVKGIAVRTLNLGGGFALASAGMDTAALGKRIRGVGGINRFGIIFEPGRHVVAEGGLLLTAVIEVKETPEHTFIVTDAGMNDNIRPALYGAFHPILSLYDGREKRVNVVGPVCESGDFQAKTVLLPLPEPGDLVAIGLAGAYSSAMASNYNSRLRAAEVLCEEGRASLLARRETYDDLFAREE